jgi:uncharacterized membrane protein
LSQSERRLVAAAGDSGDAAALSPRIEIRIERLSDLVFGLALSIGSLILVGRVPQSGQDIATNVLLFGFGFLIVVLTWLLYSRTMSVLSAEVPLAMLLNLLLLFCVALEPYLYYLVQSAQPLGLLDAASVGYALDAGSMFFLLAALAHLVIREDATGAKDRRHLHPAVLAGFRRGWKSQALVGAIFVVSALPVFWVSTPVGFLRFDLWSLPFLVLLANHVPRRSASKQG